MQSPASQNAKQTHAESVNTKSTNRDSSPASEASKDNVEDASAATWRALFFFTTKSNIPLLIAGTFFSIVAGAVSPAQSFVIGKVFDGFSSYAAGGIHAHEFMAKEKNYIFYLLMISGVSWIFLFLELAAWVAFGELQARSARDRLFHGLLKKDIGWYDMRKNGIGALLPRLQAQIRALQLATSQPLGVLASTTAEAVLSLVQAFYLAWDLTLVTIASVPVVLLAVAWVGNGMQNGFDKQGQKLSEAQKYATSALSAIETVKCFNGQEIERENYMKSVKEAGSFYYRAASANAVQMALIVLLSVSMFVQGFYYGGILVAKGKRSTADVITTFLSAISAFQAINGVLPQLIVLEKGRNAGTILRSAMAQVQQGPNARQEQGSLRPVSCGGVIEVNNVTFSYPSRPELPAIQNVSMFIPGGEMTFLIGKSGSGKSTLGHLLMRFYSFSQGSISLDGVDLGSLDVNWLRSNVTLVEQTSSLFNDTVFRNIAFGKQMHGPVTKQEVMQAAEFALLQLMINDMPNGLDTVVGYKGAGMSGGQRQRMALARARLRDTPVVILDESTSALDRISRALMMDAIRQWRQGKTTIVITHDITQILSNDYVYILEHGFVVQEGYRQHMEKLKDTPFQNFLPEELRASTSPYDARRDAGPELTSSRSSSVDSEIKRQTQIISDPLLEFLDKTEDRRMSFLPRTFKEDSPLPGMRVGAAAAAPSRWTRLAASPLLDSSPGRRWSTFRPQKEDSPLKTEVRDKRISQRLSMDLVNRTGQLAAASRTAPDGSVRQRAKPIVATSAPTQSRRRPENSKVTNAGEEEEEDVFVPKSLLEILSTLWPSIDWRTKAIFLVGGWGATVHAISSPIFSYVLSKLLKLYSIPGGDRHQALVYSMTILGLAFVNAFHTFLFHFSFEYVGQHWVDGIRDEAMKRILDQPREFFDREENAVARLTGCLDRNAEEMRNLLGRFLGLLWIAALMCVVSIVWSMTAQWKMTLIALATAPYIYGVTKAFAAVSERWEKLSNDAAEDAEAIFTETFVNVKTVRALTLEAHFLEKYTKATRYASKIGFRRAFFTGFFYGLSDSAGNFSIAMIFYVGARLVTSGASVEDIVQVFTMLIFTISNVAAILGYIPQIGSSKDTAARLLRLAQLPQTSHEHAGDTRIQTVGSILFTDLEFSYPSRPAQTILKHINLHIAPGTSTAIVGGSGSGKSTIANLLLNLYSTAQPGAPLTLSGRDIKRIHTPSLRALVVPVQQTPTLFSASVAQNIAYGLPASSPYNTPAAIAAAAQQAGIDAFVSSLPQGYDTLIGEGGLGLSGGQAQRIAIARALVRKPAVLILDEATSALDVEAAELVRQTIEGLVKAEEGAGMTVVIITHAREMMEIAETVVVLEQGRVVEVGRFGGLVAREDGALANLLRGGEWVGSGEGEGKDEGRQGVGLGLGLREVDWGR